MRLLILAFVSILIVFSSCKNSNNKTSKNDPAITSSSQKKKFKLSGTWAHFEKGSIDFYEIIDSLNVNHYYLSDDSIEFGKKVDDRYFYSKSPGYITGIEYDSVFMHSQYVNIQTNAGEYSYYIWGDALTLMVKSGEGPRYIKLYTQEEKAFRYYYSHDIKGIVQRPVNDSLSVLFITKRLLKNLKTENFKNYQFEYDFSYLEKIFENYKTLNELASHGDSILKPAFSDTLVLLKSKTREYIKIAFKKK